MYIDKLDGRVNQDFYDRKAEKWQEEQQRILKAIDTHKQATIAFADEGITLLDLARRAPTLYKQ